MKLRFLALAAVAAAPLMAQYPQGAAGFNVTTNFGQNAGYFCWGFSCTPATLNVAVGEIVTLRISGEWQANYLIGLASSATSCIPYPGIANSLVIDQPVLLLATGTLWNLSPILACPNAYDTLTAAVPAGIPSGTTLALQGLTSGAGNVLAFTGAIVLTVL